MTTMQRFLAVGAVITFFCGLIQWLINRFAPHPFVFEDGYFLLLIIAAIVGVTHLMLVRNAENRPSAFVRLFMAATVIKFLFYVLLIVFFAFRRGNSVKGIVLSFLLFYMIFTFYEIIDLYRLLNRASKIR